MQTAPPTQRRRTFSRANGADGTTVPHLVAAEERHRKNLQQIQQLKQALCSTVSGAGAPNMSAPSSRGWSSPSSTFSVPAPSGPSWMASSFESPNGVVASPLRTTGGTTPEPHRPMWTSASAAALRESQQEVEHLVRERNKLQRQCLEWASLVSAAPHRALPSAGTDAPLAFHSVLETGAWSPVHEAALAVVKQVARFYPSAVHEVESKSDVVTEDASAPPCARSSALFAAHEGELSALRLHNNSSPPPTAEELADALHRVAKFLPRLASMTSAREPVAALGPDLLHHIRALEEEKQSDCLAVLSIVDHLTEVATRLQQEAVEKDEALRVMQETVGGLMEEKSQWAWRARASEEALAERYEQHSQREKAWERELAELLQSKQNAEAASAAPMELPTPTTVHLAEDTRAASAKEAGDGHIAHLQQVLDTKEIVLSTLQEEHRALQVMHAELQTQSQKAETAHHNRIAALESQLSQLEAELQTQLGIIKSTRRKAEDVPQAHPAETAALAEYPRAILAGKEAALPSLQEAKEGVEVEVVEHTADVAQIHAELETASDKLAAAQSTSDRVGSFLLVCDGVSGSNSPVAVSTGPLRLTGLREDVAEGNGAGANVPLQMDELSTPRRRERAGSDDVEEAADSPTKHMDVRKLQQSLKRMSRENTALKRKLEHRGVALAEMEGELEAAQRLVAQRDAQVQGLTAELEKARVTTAWAPAGAKVADEDDTGEETDAETPLQLLDFSELERYEDEGTLYPDPVDLSEWLLGSTEGSSVRFSTYVQHHLSENEQLRITAVGPLYHIGFTLLQMEGLVRQETGPFCLPMAWCRFLLQLQQVLDTQLQASVLSPADSAKCFYALASSAGLFGSRANPPPDPLTAYSLIIAALCVCLRSSAASSSINSSSKWHCCQAILRHVSHYGVGKAMSQMGRNITDADSQVPDDLFAALCAEFPPATALPEEDAGDESRAASGGTASVAPLCSVRLAALLSSDFLSDCLPISTFALYVAALSDIVNVKVAPDEHLLAANLPTETTQFFEVARPRLSSTQEHDVTPLLLYAARHEYLLFGWAQEMDDAVAEAEGSAPSGDCHSADTAFLTLSSLGVSSTWPASTSVPKAPPCSATVSASAPSPTEVESITQLLIFLCTGVLPALVLAAYHCPSLERESHVINALFRTRRLLMAKRTALLAKNPTEASATSEVMPGASLLLPEAPLRNLVNAALAPIKHTAPFPERAVQVPVADYERLHHELLSLYETNETYHGYIRELLSAVETA
ncbi:hypothetical_protein [Leishmania braziliensis MHOM/BR/75/M2904]|uniref:Hypothetical_protein n=1 Tax=Leishmania braziliensis MHOM/BR/75/M2904 TaxID=420245 RepID=A0A3P3ZDF9_LEIBR|nr:hypothetical_protein [Leishmania braziliensis MHOM/BR/75/M2904]